MDDTSRGLGDDAMEGRGDDTARDYAGADATTPTARTPSTRARSTGRRAPGSPSSDVAGPTPISREATSNEKTDALDPDSDRRARELRAEIEQTREEMSETIDAIQEKLRPGNVVAEATERVKNATTERVKNMVGSASQSAQGAMERTRHMAGDLMDSGSQTAIPAAMIGIGAAWLLIDRLRNRDREYDSDYRRGYRTSGSWQPQYGEYGAQGYGAEGYRYESEEQSGVGETLDRVSSRASEAASQARYAAMRTSRRARNQFQRLLQDNPLLVGAAAVLVGAAVGMALPETERENEWMGEAKENFVDRAQDMARNAATRAQEAAGDLAGEVASQVVSGSKDTNR
jgi:hypothetical protein